MSGSEIARFREQQQLEEESAQLGLSGMAAVASHDAIIARIEQGGSTLLQMFQNGQGAEAYSLWEGGYLEGTQS